MIEVPPPTEQKAFMNPYVRPPAAGPLSRRAVMLHAGLAAVTLTGLAACGNDAEPAGPTTSGPVSAKTSDIPVGGGKIFSDGQAVITQPTVGEFKAFSSICTHARCPVTEVTSTINCQCHGSKFALADGAVVNGPASSPLPAKTVEVDGGTLTVSA